MVTEFGGVSFTGDPETWGYARVDSEDAYRALLRELFEVIRAAGIGGYCYTQLTDTWQEANGLLTAARQPKLPIPVLRAIVTGGPAPG